MFPMRINNTYMYKYIIYVLLTNESSSGVLAHKVDTEERRGGLSAASFAIWSQLHPRVFVNCLAPRFSTAYLSLSLPYMSCLPFTGCYVVDVISKYDSIRPHTHPNTAHVYFSTNISIHALPIEADGKHSCRIRHRGSTPS